MQDTRVIYPNNEGGVSIIVPAAECTLTLEQIAQKDVPTGAPYWFVDEADIPTDRTERDSWTLTDMPKPDGVGA